MCRPYYIHFPVAFSSFMTHWSQILYKTGSCLAHSTVATHWLAVLTPDRAVLVTRALPCRPGKGIFFTVPLHANATVGAGDYHPVQGRAITNLSCSRHEALRIGTTHYTTYSKHTGHPGDYCFLIWKSELKASNSTARSAISSSLWREIHSSLVLSSDIYSAPI